MPYITLAEQGVRQPGDVIQEAAHNLLLRQQMEQQITQRKQAFPIEQQMRQAQASQATTIAEAAPAMARLNQAHQELTNDLAQVTLEFTRETNPMRKAQLEQQGKNLAQQLELLKAQAAHAQEQVKLTTAQTGEAEKRGQLTDEQIKNAQLARADTTIDEGELDPYGNQVITTKKSVGGVPAQTTQTFERGRGIPRVAYKSVFDPKSGMMRRVPGVLQVDPETNELGIQFNDEESQKPQEEVEPDNMFKALVGTYFDAETGKRNGKAPATAFDRAQLKKLQNSPAQMEAWGLDAYSDGAGTLPRGPVPRPAAAPVPARRSTATSSTTSGPGPSPVGGADSAQPSGTTAGAPPVIQPNPADGPQAGITPGGAPVKTGAEAGAGKPAAAQASGVPLASGRKSGGKFGDLEVGAFFYQGGKRFKKTGATQAVPADEEAAAPAPQTATLPPASGL